MKKSFETNCPKCGAEMKQIQGEGMMVEYCPNCHGMFLDYHEVINPLNQQFARVVQERKDAVARDEQDISCLKCGVAMKKRRYISKLGLLLDVCPSCGGIWFDQNELAQYCHPLKTRWKKPHKMRAALYCASCGIETIYDPAREKPFTCPHCGAPLSFLAKGVVFKNHLEPEMAKPLFTILLGVMIMECIFIVAALVFKNSLQAMVFAGTIGMVVAFIIVRAVVYGKFAWMIGIGPGHSQDFDI